MTVKSADTATVRKLFARFHLPKPESHKGQNGKVLLVGGSSLFHSASIWGAQTASHFVDMVHYASTEENNEIMLSLKKKFLNGIVISQDEILQYAKEDDVILVGLGMMREGPEATYTKDIVTRLTKNYPDKRFVFDAGALQTMDVAVLTSLKTKPVITPHQKEFETMFGISIEKSAHSEKEQIVRRLAGQHNCIILLKAIVDIVSDGTQSVFIDGGNAGLTKGGTGDVLAALTASFYAKNSPFDSAMLASILLKRSADSLRVTDSYWYNIDDLINQIPKELSLLTETS